MSNVCLRQVCKTMICRCDLFVRRFCQQRYSSPFKPISQFWCCIGLHVLNEEARQDGIRLRKSAIFLEITLKTKQQSICSWYSLFILLFDCSHAYSCCICQSPLFLGSHIIIIIPNFIQANAFHIQAQYNPAVQLYTRCSFQKLGLSVQCLLSDTRG